MPMDKQKLAQGCEKAKIVWGGVVELGKKVLEVITSKITSWWQIAAGLVLAIVFLYYPIGGWMINSIDTSSAYKAKSVNGNLAAIDMVSHLVNREVHEKMWTPNLPFLFPCYFLDNMPNFQLGLMSAVGQVAAAMDRIAMPMSSTEADEQLSEAAELLQYPGNVWLFSPQNKLLPVPSSNTQYKKGRKKLNNFNHEMALGKVVLPRSAQNLTLILKNIRKDMLRQIGKVEGHVRENQKNWIDLKADDVFYFSQGKLYAYAQILRALGMDFKDVLVKYEVYQQWTAMLKSLDEASDLNPTIVRNAKVNSSLAPNHLAVINYFAARAVNRLDNVIDRLSAQQRIK